MTTVAPVDQRASVPAVFAANFDDDEALVPAGYFHFADGYDGTQDVGILFGCPCGCGSLNYVAVKPYAGTGPQWAWDGNRDAPTLTPSILIHQMNQAAEKIGEHWHGYLTAGQFRSC